MTREEQRAVRELNKIVQKSIRVQAKQYGYKSIMGYVYKVVNENLYELIISVPPIGLGKRINADLWMKPIVLDDIYWEVFEMEDVKDSQPFSFRVNGAFVADTYTLERWEVTIDDIEDVDKAFEIIFAKTEEFLEYYKNKFVTIDDFKQELIKQEKGYYQFNIILCEILQGNYDQALERILAALEQNEHGGFASPSGSIMEYAKRYCEKRIE